jgi:hypothetical protein
MDSVFCGSGVLFSFFFIFLFLVFVFLVCRLCGGGAMVVWVFRSFPGLMLQSPLEALKEFLFLPPLLTPWSLSLPLQCLLP